MNHCMRHFEEPTAGTCRTCQGVFCSRCLVFAFGPKKPPYCIGCALTASGVRNGRVPWVVAPPAPSFHDQADDGTAPAVVAAVSSRRAARAERRAAREQAKAASRAERNARRHAGPAIVTADPIAAAAAVPTDAAPDLQPVGPAHDARVPAPSELAMAAHVPNTGQPI